MSSTMKSRYQAAALGMLIALVLTMVPAAGTSQTAHASAICTFALDARDLGGGTWRDRNYVVETTDGRLSKYDLGGWTNRGFAEIKYQGVTLKLNYHGKFGGRHRWGVSTAWAYGHPGWNNDSRWRLYIPCDPYLA